MEDDELIRSFMLAGREEIADDGFRERVMERIPREKPMWLTAALIVVGIIVALAIVTTLFLSLNGWNMVCHAIVRGFEALTALRHTTISFNPIYTLIIAPIILWLGAEKVKQLA